LSKPVPIRLPRSQTARFVLLCLLLTLLITGPSLLFIYERTDAIIHDRIEARIDDRQANLLFGYKTAGTQGLLWSINNEVQTGIVQGGVILLTNASGERMAGNVVSWPPTLREPTSWREMRLYTQGASRPELYAVRVVHLPSGHWLLFGTNLEARERMRAALAEALLAAFLIAIPAGLIAGFILHRFTNRRVRSIGQIAARIASGDFSQRLDTSGEGEAYEQLGGAINAMLSRIEELVGGLRAVTDALAHDLRSPLMRIQAGIEKAARECEDDVSRDAFASVSREIGGMMRLISSILEIGRTEAGIGRENFTEFHLGDLIRDLCEMYQPLVEERGFEIDAKRNGDLPFFGNRELLGQAVSNLVDNALKYGGCCRIELGADESESEFRLWVADNGPGIPEDSREHAMQKYGRLEEARTLEGSGLGLSLVRAVASLHGGDLSLEDNGPGLRAVMRLPKPADAIDATEVSSH
jgi:signal transduction histidine kinase